MAGSVMHVDINVTGDGKCEGEIAVRVCYNGTPVEPEDTPAEVARIIGLLEILPFDGLTPDKKTCPTCAGVGLVD
jgi:hypothetical protein